VSKRVTNHEAPKPGFPTTIGEPWLALVNKAGSVTELAEALGISRNTLHRWFNGHRPSKLTRAAVDSFAMKRKVSPPFGGK
jgi:hypothetical protein